MTHPTALIIRNLGTQEYHSVWQAMQNFTRTRDFNTQDELWLVEHPPVFTEGLASKPEHIHNPRHIPVIKTDRGGQVTYHGPGQLIAYPLLDLKRKSLNIRQLVTELEKTIISLLVHYNITASSRLTAPGVYTNDQKIASIGLRVRRNCCYHGIALNHSMDLIPFTYINPCGYQGLQMTQMSDLISPVPSFAELQQQFISTFSTRFGYTTCNFM